MDLSLNEVIKIKLYSHCKIIDSHRTNLNIVHALVQAIHGIAIQMEINDIDLIELEKIKIEYEPDKDYGDCNNSWLVTYEVTDG